MPLEYLHHSGLFRPDFFPDRHRSVRRPGFFPGRHRNVRRPGFFRRSAGGLPVLSHGRPAVCCPVHGRPAVSRRCSAALRPSQLSLPVQLPLSPGPSLSQLPFPGPFPKPSLSVCSLPLLPALCPACLRPAASVSHLALPCRSYCSEDGTPV